VSLVFFVPIVQGPGARARCRSDGGSRRAACDGSHRGSSDRSATDAFDRLHVPLMPHILPRSPVTMMLHCHAWHRRAEQQSNRQNTR